MPSAKPEIMAGCPYCGALLGPFHSETMDFAQKGAHSLGGQTGWRSRTRACCWIPHWLAPSFSGCPLLQGLDPMVGTGPLAWPMNTAALGQTWQQVHLICQPPSPFLPPSHVVTAQDLHSLGCSVLLPCPALARHLPLGQEGEKQSQAAVESGSPRPFSWLPIPGHLPRPAPTCPR